LASILAPLFIFFLPYLKVNFRSAIFRFVKAYSWTLKPGGDLANLLLFTFSYKVELLERSPFRVFAKIL